MTRATRIAVVGDVHLVWDDRDVRALDAEAYDLALFVGDFAGYGASGALLVARSIARLRTPALVIPGNHDAVTVPQLAAEVFRASDALRSASTIGMSWRVRALARALGPIPLCGYSVHPLDGLGLGLTVLAARPHSMGGERISFRRYMSARFGVDTFEQSTAKLCGLFDEIPSGRPIIVLAHCGPHGLGSDRDAIFGCDFRPGAGDWGDLDLMRALEHARATNKSVIAVVAGHMHHALRGGGARRWQLQQNGVQYVNAAQVPRSRRGAGSSERHHVRLELVDGDVRVTPVWLAVGKRAR